MQKRKIIFLFLVATIFIYSGIAEAGLQYLPRYQGSYSGRNQSGGRDKITITCASKGGVEKGANQTCTGPFSAGGKTCYKSCSCPSSYQYTVASHQGTGKLCASLSNACTINNVTKYSVCNLNTCNARNSTWIGESSKASYTSNNYACASQNTSGKDGTCYVCACPSSWASGSCPANAASCSSCKAISPYTVNKFNLISCKAGYYKNGNACTQCPAGSYCNGTSKNTCPAGSYSAAGASSCTSCPKGQYSAAGATACTNCPAGKYSDTSGASSCSTCSAGTYSTAGATSCTSCSDGKYSTAGSSSCISCSPRKSNSTHTGCVDCTTNADCTKVSGGTCSGGSCTYPVVSCNSSTDRTNEKTACGATVAGYQCSACTSQAADGTQTAGQFTCSCAAKTLFPNGSAGSGSGGYLMTGANYGIDTLCDGWHIVCPNSGCKAGYYYSGGGCLACTGNTYSSARATSCKACPAGQNVNADHTGCEAAFDCSAVAVTVPANAHCTGANVNCPADVCTAWECDSGYTANSNNTACEALVLTTTINVYEQWADQIGGGGCWGGPWVAPYAKTSDGTFFNFPRSECHGGMNMDVTSRNDIPVGSTLNILISKSPMSQFALCSVVQGLGYSSTSIDVYCDARASEVTCNIPVPNLLTVDYAVIWKRPGDSEALYNGVTIPCVY